MSLQPGIHDIPAAAYHADPCPLPSLSSSGARRLLNRSPLHAYHNHPKLGGGNDEPPTRAMNDGTVLHMLMLGKGAEVAVVDADDWRKKTAQDARDEAIAADRIPVLARRMDELERIAESALMQMRDHPACEAFFAPGQSEAVCVWKEGKVWCRSMIDRLPNDEAAPMFDIKSTGLSANPHDYERKLATDYAFQDAFYRRGIRRATGTPREMRFVVIEMDAPHAISVMACSTELLAVAEANVERAIALWGKCLAAGEWPSYPKQVAYVDAPRWLLAQAEQNMESAA